jgi:hypothetical protein
VAADIEDELSSSGIVEVASLGHVVYSQQTNMELRILVDTAVSLDKVVPIVKVEVVASAHQVVVILDPDLVELSLSQDVLHLEHIIPKRALRCSGNKHACGLGQGVKAVDTLDVRTLVV